MMPSGFVTVADGLHRIDTPLGDRFASIYLAVGSQSALLYDTGVNGAIPERVLPALVELGLDPRDVGTVVISHCDVDHFGGAADARESFPRAALVAHELDRPAIENFSEYVWQRGRGFLSKYGWDEDASVLEWCRSVTRETHLSGPVADGDEIDLGDRTATIWHVPGHSLGHTAIDLPFAGAVLVSDAVLGRSVNLSDGTPAFPPTYRFVDAYLETVARLATHGHQKLLTAHYQMFEGDSASAFLEESRIFAEELDALLLGLLGGSAPLTLAEMLRELNPVAGSWPTAGTEGALAFPVVGHLERLEAAGVVRAFGAREGVSLWGIG